MPENSPTLGMAVEQIRLKLRDQRQTGLLPRYTDGELCVFVANALSRLYRTKRVAFWGRAADAEPPSAVIAAIHGLSGSDALDDSVMQGGLPLPIGWQWLSRIVNSSAPEAETTQQQGARPESQLPLQAEELQG